MILKPSFTATSTGFTVQFGVDSTKLPNGFESFDLSIEFDAGKYALDPTPVNTDFAGQFAIVSTTIGKVVVASISSSAVAATTRLGVLTFKRLTTGPLVLTITEFVINETVDVSDNSPLVISSGGAIDTTPPLLSSSDPPQNATVSPTKEFLTLNFNEAILLGTGTIQLKTAAGSVVESFDVANSSRVVRTGSSVKIDPASNLVGGTSYILSIPAGAFKDASNNSYAGTNLAFATSASNTDLTAPTLALATPSTGTTEVSTSTKIVLKFSEAVKLGTGQIRLLGAGGVLVQAFDSSTVGVAIAGDTITLSPTAELSKASTYTLQIPSGAITDIAGNAFAGVTSYQFTTAALAAGEITLTVDRTTVNEGNTISFLLASTSAAGSVLSYTLSGIAASDLDGTALSGTLTLNSSRTATLSIKMKADELTEGTETLVLNIGGTTRSVTINDTSVASTATQSLKGSFDPEVFLMTSGIDSVDGGSGIDTAFVNGDSSEYEFTRQGDEVFMAQKSSQNIDTLIDVERVEFRDRAVALDTDAGPGQAYRIYKAAFNRQPDLAGIGYWISRMDDGMDMIELAQRFVDSDEFRNLYGSKPSNAAFVAKLYQNVLGRAPDDTGYDWWVNKMNTDPSKSFAKVLADFSESTENTIALAGQMEAGVEYAPCLC